MPTLRVRIRQGLSKIYERLPARMEMPVSPLEKTTWQAHKSEADKIAERLHEGIERGFLHELAAEAGLSELELRVTELKGFENLQHEEIAEILTEEFDRPMSAESSRQALRRARRKIKQKPS